jgi:hypothetical protein
MRVGDESGAEAVTRDEVGGRGRFPSRTTGYPLLPLLAAFR